MRSFLATLRQLVLPYGARVPTDAAMVIGPDLPPEIAEQFPQFKAAIVGYVGDYDPALTTPQIKYHFIGLYVDTMYNAQALGYLLDMDATSSDPADKRVIVTLTSSVDDADAGNPFRTAVQLGANANYGKPSDYVQMLGAVYSDQTLDIKNTSDDLNGWRGWKAGTFNSGWSDYGGGFDTFAAKRTVTGDVHIKGVVKGGTKTHNTHFATLPTDDNGAQSWAPSHNTIFYARTDNTNGITGVYAQTDGSLYLQTSGSALGAPGTYLWLNFSWSALS